MLVKCKNTNNIVSLPYNLGDYVCIVDTGGHYSSYNKAFKQFWGNTETCKFLNHAWKHRDYFFTWLDYQIWVVKGFLFHENGRDVLMHLQTLNGKENCVFSATENFYNKERNYCQIIKKAKIDNEIIEIEQVKKTYGY